MKLKLLTQNAKMKKTSKLTGKKTYDFALPAMSTCPFAGECKKYCYASKGSFMYPVVKAKHEANYQATKDKDFTVNMIEEIIMSEAECIRLHSSGDFYSREYFIKWRKIANALPHITFYAYTKSLPHTTWYPPENLILLYSFGGTHDHIIDKKTDRHAIVIKKGESVPMDYAIANNNDHLALASNKKIALLEH